MVRSAAQPRVSNHATTDHNPATPCRVVSVSLHNRWSFMLWMLGIPLPVLALIYIFGGLN